MKRKNNKTMIARAMMTFSRAASRSEELMQASFFSRSIGALTLFVMLLTTMTAGAEDPSGSCGTSAKWTLSIKSG
jgi:hypothetical protein